MAHGRIGKEPASEKSARALKTGKANNWFGGQCNVVFGLYEPPFQVLVTQPSPYVRQYIHSCCNEGSEARCCVLAGSQSAFIAISPRFDCQDVGAQPPIAAEPNA